MLFCSAYKVIVPAEGKQLVKTDIAIALPPGCYGRVGMYKVYVMFIDDC